MEQREKDLEYIINYYGYEPQSRQLIKEMAELTQAINKRWRALKYGTDGDFIKAHENMIEEIADVEICLEQIKLLFGDTFKSKVEAVKDYKVNRALERIEKREKKK